MKNNVLIFFAAALIFSFADSCSKSDSKEEINLKPKSITLTAVAPQAIQSSNEFGVELFTRVCEAENRNLMLSPLSASTALTMLLNGCGGDSYSQLQGTLKYPEGMTIGDINEAYRSLVDQLLNADPKVKLALANAIFYHNSFSVKPPFLATMDKDFNATAEALDFMAPSALKTINKWASDNTNGKIPEVLDEIDPDAVMFIMNALYFNGDWSYQFDKSLTQERPFYPDGGSTIDVNTMNGEVGSRVVYGNGFKAIEMPYGRTNFTMTVIVPEGTLKDFYSSFTAPEWEELTSDLDGIDEFDKVIVFMPRFSLEYEKNLNHYLMSMGMIDAFSPFLADLSGISDKKIYVSFVKQNTFVEVDEEGTEAAAVTTIGVFGTTSGTGPSSPVFVIDKSFVFAIRERTTNALLFIGQVLNPEE
jgi:serpin B